MRQDINEKVKGRGLDNVSKIWKSDVSGLGGTDKTEGWVENVL